jgi:1-acyl-sn-glycerol-3-phosphate acyltransferase
VSASFDAFDGWWIPRDHAVAACPRSTREECDGMRRRALEDDEIGATPSSRRPTTETISKEIARLSAKEIEAAVRGTRAPSVMKSAIAHLARRPSARLGQLLARFDADVAERGLVLAASAAMTELGATLDVDGQCPPSGPVLLVTNHPGAYDALALMAALGRDDLAIVAADREFLRAMPRLGEHLVFVAGDDTLARARGVREALDRLRRGQVVVQFGAGAIEPDAKFTEPHRDVLGAWGEGTGMLAARAARARAAVVPCFVSGVHSPRAKRLFFVRWAERAGITTIAPLVQATAPGFRDVGVYVRIGSPIEPERLIQATGARERTRIVRDAVAALAKR